MMQPMIDQQAIFKMSPMRSRLGLSALALSAIVMCGATASAQNARMVAGTLTCRGNGTIGLILGSSQRMDCVFQRSKGGAKVNYTARITRIGLDLGVTGRNTMVWTVLSSTTDPEARALVGRYGGVAANASLGVGVGANALIGGSSESIVLQPLSVQVQTGVNVAAGVKGLTLSR
ncbi:DUF992 domain-containing protein [Hyphomicrobium sp.]|uniref:DUF992 domain-containing protein n=1 Tax=Hyphomicrobium sp. TaxID=82 RepID=UPI002FE2FE1F